MREIKFRAWNGDKMIHYNHWFTLHDQNVLCFEKSEEHSYVDESDVDYPRRVELMQFTGLKDKNGKEIYEGDILEMPWGMSRRAVRIPGMFYSLGEEGCWDDESEVIGNIYENPELLTKDL